MALSSTIRTLRSRDITDAIPFNVGQPSYVSDIWTNTTVAGMWNVFLPHIESDHIDPGETEYQSWKEKHSSEVTQQVIKITHEYYHGVRPIYYNPYQ